ncbi:MAG: RsmD family RNA methyltransferase, partial [Chthoniobacterales bacterium]
NFIRTKLRGRVRRQEVFAFLESSPPNETFDIILADPPYEQRWGGGEFTRSLLQNEKLAGLLDPSGVFVLEKRPSEELPPHPLWEIVRQRKYGATEVLTMQHAA